MLTCGLPEVNEKDFFFAGAAAFFVPPPFLNTACVFTALIEAISTCCALLGGGVSCTAPAHNLSYVS